MKKKEIQDLRHKTIEELKALVKKSQEELLKLKLDKEAGKLKNVHLIETKRHDLARIKTLLREKELNL